MPSSLRHCEPKAKQSYNAMRLLCRYTPRNDIFRLICFTLLFTSLFPLQVYAHKPSDSYITIKKHDTNKSLIHAQWDISLRDLDYALGLDDNNDGNITWGEVKRHHKDIEDYAFESMRIKAGEKYCKNQINKHSIDNHSDGAYAILDFFIDCQSSKRPKIFDLEYSLFFEFDPQHRGLLKIQHNDKTLTAIFSPEKSIQHFNLDLLNPLNQFLEFTKEGIWHIWIGFDHILFLLALLLPAVLIKYEGKWIEISDFKTAFWNVFKIVTAFTIAHSITLSIAALEIIELPSRLVESLIALSVIIAALNNIFPIFNKGRWFIAFLFGLIHGFGFASVLMDLGLTQSTLLIALVSFNIGVEIGQLFIVFVFMPISYKINKTSFYKNIVFYIGSIAIALIAMLWFIERIFNLSFMPF